MTALGPTATLSMFPSAAEITGVASSTMATKDELRFALHRAADQLRRHEERERLIGPLADAIDALIDEKIAAQKVPA